MRETLTISKGNQYDRNGYYLASDNGLYAFGCVDGERVTFDGTWFSVEHKAAAEDVIRQVIADGQERQFTVGEAPRHADYRSLAQYPYGSRGSEDACE